jgi:hypothetical protein
MNTNEFKAWFEGFTECMEGTPNKKQWEKIKQRVDEITSEPTTVRYFYDHYYHPYQTGTYYISDYSRVGTLVVGGGSALFCDGQNQFTTAPMPDCLSSNAVSLGSFSSLGKLDALSISSN